MGSFRFHCMCPRCLEDEEAPTTEEEEEEDGVNTDEQVVHTTALGSCGVVVRRGDDDDLAVAVASCTGAGSEDEDEEEEDEEGSNRESASEWVDHSKPGGDEEAWRWLDTEQQLLGSVQHLDLGEKGCVAFRIEGFSIKLDNAFKATKYVVIRALQTKGGPQPQQREMEWAALQPLLAKAQHLVPTNEME